MERAKEEMRCPQCQGVVEQESAIALSSMLYRKAYLCRACKMLYYHDLKPWVQVML